ncbi:MAG: hypothetical protein Q4B03_07095 [Lachnospiraceae bacterium]|nr:hypothetical protein [Lachnospiraceae bacterium]
MNPVRRILRPLDVLNPVRRILRLLNVLILCEKFRIQSAKSEREEKRANRRNNLAEWVPWIEQKEKNAVETEEQSLPRVLYQSLPGLTSSLIEILFFLTAGVVLGLLFPRHGLPVFVWKSIFAAGAVLLLIRMLYPVEFALYREENLPYYLTMPFTSTEFLLAEFLRLTAGVYLRTTIVFLPLWLGYVVTGGTDRFLTAAVLLGLLLIPQSVLLTDFLIIILFHSYTRLLLPERRRAGLLLPAVVLLFLFFAALVPVFLTGGKTTAWPAWLLLEILAFNYPLGLLIQGFRLVPALLLIGWNVVIWIAYGRICRRLYRPSILQRWDLADDRRMKKTDLGRVRKKHGLGRALFLREFRTARGMKAYRFPVLFSHVLLPAGLLVLCILTEGLHSRLFPQEADRVQYLAAVLLRDFLPLSILPALWNMTAATAFSRDYASRDALKLIPAGWDMLLQKKLLFSVCGGISGGLPFVLFLALWLSLNDRIPAWGFLPALLLHVLVAAALTVWLVIRDVRHPIREWKNYKDLLKKKRGQGKPAVRLLPAAAAFFAGVLVEAAGLSGPIVIAALFSIAVAFPVLSYLLLFEMGLQALDRLDQEPDEDPVGRERV